MHGGGSCVAEGGCMGGGLCMHGDMHSRGCAWHGGMCGRSMAEGMHAWRERWPLQQMVHILLECILVQHENILHKN